MSLVDVVIITGAGRGIGKSIALDFASRKIPVLCISKTNSCQTTAEEINKMGGNAGSLILDITDYELAEKKINEWIKLTNYKKIGVILAAAILGPQGPITNCSLKEWDNAHKTNVLGNLAILKGLLPRMLENMFGRIVFFAGGGSAYAFPVFPAYSATKTATVRLTENIFEDLKEKGDFSIVCLGPGAIDTDMLKQVLNAGAEVKSKVDISEPVAFVREFVESSACAFSGRFMHVKDKWKEYINSDKELDEKLWKLRRIE